MVVEKDIIKMVFGFKVKYLRQQKGLSFHQLSERTGLSTSYLHDIEKGKKYPKIDKISALAEALGVSYDFMVSTRASKKIQPVIDLLTSGFLKEFPLDQFGISPDKIFELFSNTPDKVNAFVSTIFKVTRNYQLQREHLFLAALRSYQDMYDNYFPELERAVRSCRTAFNIRGVLPYSVAFLEGLLRERFGLKVDRKNLKQYTDLSGLRSYFSRKKGALFLNRGLSPAQEKFLLGRELAFQYLGLAPRPYLTRILEVDSFDLLLNNFKASYFSVALLMDEQLMVEDIEWLAGQRRWQPQEYLSLLDKYDVSPEMFQQRLTNILPQHFGIKDLFFIRLAGDADLKTYRMTKELHLSQIHNPYANMANEHYCRRWVSVNIIKEMRARQQLGGEIQPMADAQISKYWETDNSYLCLSIAKSEVLSGSPVSVTVGLLINERLRGLFKFLDDVPERIVNTTCEHCSISDCEARAAPPVALEAANKMKRLQQAIEKLEENA